MVLTLEAQAACVVLLHGLARSSASMEVMELSLAEEGYQVVNVDYPSTQFPIEHLADQYIEPALEVCEVDQAIHFVTHSMGGILVRQYLNTHTISELGRTVMLGPPNGGSEVVDVLGPIYGFEWINGPAGMQLGTSNSSVSNQLGPANFDVGIIAGTRSINLVLSQIIPDVDDGKVSLQSAKLEGMNDFISLPVSHPFLMKDGQVIEQGKPICNLVVSSARHPRTTSAIAHSQNSGSSLDPIVSRGHFR